MIATKPHPCPQSDHWRTVWMCIASSCIIHIADSEPPSVPTGLTELPRSFPGEYHAGPPVFALFLLFLMQLIECCPLNLSITKRSQHLLQHCAVTSHHPLKLSLVNGQSQQFVLYFPICTFYFLESQPNAKQNFSSSICIIWFSASGFSITPSLREHCSLQILAFLQCSSQMLHPENLKSTCLMALN